MTTPIATRASASKPCPVCNSGSKGCSITEDALHLCRGDARPGWKRLTKEPDGAGFHHYRSEDDDRNLRREPGQNGPPAAKPAPDWSAEAARYAAALTPELKNELARTLNLPAEALDTISQIGWRTDDYHADCWTFPDRKADGSIVGLSRRYRDGSKKSVGNRGLAIPAGWRNLPGPIFVVEGASDTLALSQCGLAAIGRPSNTGGETHLTDLFGDIEKDRPIVVVGENDRKENGDWPGRYGAESLSKKLADALRRRVMWALPPAAYKDVRAWVLDAAAGAAEEVDWRGIGADVRAALLANSNAGSRFKFLDSAEFLTREIKREWIIPNVFVKDEPGVIAGPSKGMKTSVLVDLAVSIATATPFLGKWEIRAPKRVAIVSGESGEHTLKETCLRIMKAKDVALPSLGGRLKWEFTLPTLSDLESMVDFGDSLKDLAVDVAIIDPLYLTLGEVDARSIFDMGRVLRRVAEQLIKAGITPLIAHHANKMLPAGQPMELQHLAYAGLDAFTRQALLLNRREPYRIDGIHDMWLRIGGSAGHGSLSVLRIEEGVTDESFKGRFWNVDVKAFGEAIADDRQHKEAAARDRRLEAMRLADNEVLSAIDAELRSGRHGATTRRIRERTGFGDAKAREAIARLVEAGAIQSDEWMQETGQGARQLVKGFRPVSEPSEAPGLFQE